MNAELLNQAFHSFTTVSRNLETYYELLQERVRYLTDELERKNEQLHDALSETEKTKDYLDAILYHLEEAIIAVDPRGRVTMINKSAEELLCLERAETLGKLFTDLDFTIAREGSEILLRVGGKRFSIILSHSSVLDARGSLRGKVILIKDITKLRELELQHERNQRLIAMGEMAAKIVHEVRNPLCSMELFAGLLSREIDNPDHRELAKGISTGISNLNNILSNMLFFARPHRASMKKVRLGTVMEESLRMVMPVIESRKITVEKSTCDPEITADGELLKQVFMNIIINAAQSMGDGGRIAIAMREDDPFDVVEVKDQGDGIDDENLEKIFDPFFSTKERGTGLGLAIASKIMQAHGGYIKVSSEKGEGSVFSLFFLRERKDQ